MCVLSAKISCYDIKGYNLLVLEVVPIEESPAKVFGPLTEMETLFLHIKCGDQCSRPTTHTLQFYKLVVIDWSN